MKIQRTRSHSREGLEQNAGSVTRVKNARLDKQIQNDFNWLSNVVAGNESPPNKLLKVLQKTTGLATPTPEGHLKATAGERALTYSALGLIGANLAQAAASIHSPGLAAVAASAAVLGYGSAEVGTALVHHALDNYGSKDTPIFGKAIESFQWHHIDQMAETRSSFAGSAARAAMGAIGPLAAGLALHAGVPVEVFLAVASLGAVMATENHKMAHLKPENVPLFYKVAQRVGLSVPRDGDGSDSPEATGQGGHRSHHESPHDGYYGIVNGASNQILDQGFFRQWERIIFDLTGAEPNTWKLDPHKKIESLGPERGYDAAAFRAVAAKEQLIADTKGQIGDAEVERLREVFPMLEQRDGAWVFADKQSRNDNNLNPVPLLDEKGRLGREAKLRLAELIPDKSKFEEHTIDWI
jgi:hypothetical protein